MISHTSWQKLSQSTSVLSAKPSLCFICAWSRSWHHQNVSLRISFNVMLLYSNQPPFLIKISALCLLLFSCLLHSHLNKSDRSSQLAKLINFSHRTQTFLCHEPFLNQPVNQYLFIPHLPHKVIVPPLLVLAVAAIASCLRNLALRRPLLFTFRNFWNGFANWRSLARPFWSYCNLNCLVNHT